MLIKAPVRNLLREEQRCGSTDGTFGTSPFTEANGGIRDSFNVTSTIMGLETIRLIWRLLCQMQTMRQSQQLVEVQFRTVVSQLKLLVRTTTTFQVYISCDGTGGSTYTASKC